MPDHDLVLILTTLAEVLADNHGVDKVSLLEILLRVGLTCRAARDWFRATKLPGQITMHLSVRPQDGPLSFLAELFGLSLIHI